MAGFTCAGESPDHRDRRPSADATAVARLRRAGAVIVAKTVAWRAPSGDTVVRHPADPDRSPGGSSTGEAIAVASGASPLGVGSDSGGSIRLPAAWCGACGLKPTAGRVPGTGHFPRVGALSDGRTQIGPLARSVDDLGLVLGIIAGPDWRDAGVVQAPLGASRRPGTGRSPVRTSSSPCLPASPDPRRSRYLPGPMPPDCPSPSSSSGVHGRITGCWQRHAC